MAVYGSLLSAFPELLHNINIYKMQPKSGGGYNQRTVAMTVRGYFSRAAKSPTTIIGDNKVENERATLHCYDFINEGAIAQGLYLEDAGDLFQIVDDNIYAREGGFSAYSCHIVQGTIDTQTENTGPVKVIINDY